MRKPSLNLRFRRNVIARYARASFVKGVSSITIRYAAEEQRDNVRTMALNGEVYPARWLYTDTLTIFAVQS